MLESWNIARSHYRKGRRIAVQAVDPTALPKRTGAAQASAPQARRRVPLP